MPLPALAHWDATRDSLHAITRVMTALRKAYLAPQPLALHLALYVTPYGLTTGPTDAGEFMLNFARDTIEYRAHSDKTVWFPLAKYRDTAGMARDLLDEMGGLHSTGQVVLPENTALNVIPAISTEYGNALFRLYSAIARFRARLAGTMSPAVVWSHHFDLSFLWFKGNELDDYQPHINIGFTPYGPGFPRPYVYLTVYPLPEGITSLQLPSLARWYTGDWTGIVIDYDTLAAESNPDDRLEALLLDLHGLLAARL